MTLPWSDGRIADCPKAGISDDRIRRAKHGVIEGVRSVKAQFQFHGFVLAREAKVFGDGQVGGPEEGRSDTRKSSRRITQGVSRRQLESARIGKVLVYPTGLRARVPGH